MEDLTRALFVPVNAVIIVILLPFLVLKRCVTAMSDLLDGVPSVLDFGDMKNALKFINSSEITESVLKTKFPNSIAVRS